MSRKELLDESDGVDTGESEEEEEDSGERGYAMETEGRYLEGQGSNNAENEDDLVPNDIGRRRAVQSPLTHDAMDDESSQDVTATLKRAREEDILKGQAVTVQLVCKDFFSLQSLLD